MLISKKLLREIRKLGAIVLLDDGKDENDRPRLVLREVMGTWGKCDPFKGGVCFAELSDRSTHIRYDSVLGYNTGHKACVQQLLLMEHGYTFSSLPRAEWKSFVQSTTQLLLDARSVENHRLTVEALTTMRYWYRDNWSGDIHPFIRLNDAKRYARRETGTSVTIYTTSKNQAKISCFAAASGHCPP